MEETSETPQQWSDRIGEKVYAYRLIDNTVVYTPDCLRKGDKYDGKSIKEVMGCWKPKGMRDEAQTAQ